jgi:tetratricopeptide (TPR) repeat protein
MSEPLHSEPSRAADALSGVERDARVEQLLLQGLDHYFAGEYDQAIHVWTRVLFIDRNQTRARAYIERARNALSERQRESEELLHRGVDAFDRGDTGDARELLTAAVQNGVAPDIALSYLGRLDRLTAAPQGRAGRPEIGHTVSDGGQRPRTPPERRRAVPAGTFVVLATLAVLAIWGAPALWEARELRDALDVRGAAPSRVTQETDHALPVPRLAESVLADARALAARGRSIEALRVLQRIGVTDPLKPEADRLRAEIQAGLLGTVVAPGEAP